jgi:hypothetical protein
MRLLVYFLFCCFYQIATTHKNLEFSPILIKHQIGRYFLTIKNVSESINNATAARYERSKCVR